MSKHCNSNINSASAASNIDDGLEEEKTLSEDFPSIQPSIHPTSNQLPSPSHLLHLQGSTRRWSPGCVNAACTARQKW